MRRRAPYLVRCRELLEPCPLINISLASKLYLRAQKSCRQAGDTEECNPLIAQRRNEGAHGRNVLLTRFMLVSPNFVMSPLYFNTFSHAIYLFSCSGMGIRSCPCCAMDRFLSCSRLFGPSESNHFVSRDSLPGNQYGTFIISDRLSSKICKADGLFSLGNILSQDTSKLRLVWCLGCYFLDSSNVSCLGISGAIDTGY